MDEPKIFVNLELPETKKALKELKTLIDQKKEIETKIEEQKKQIASLVCPYKRGDLIKIPASATRHGNKKMKADNIFIQVNTLYPPFTLNWVITGPLLKADGSTSVHYGNIKSYNLLNRDIQNTAEGELKL